MTHPNPIKHCDETAVGLTVYLAKLNGNESQLAKHFGIEKEKLLVIPTQNITHVTRDYRLKLKNVTNKK